MVLCDLAVLALLARLVQLAPRFSSINFIWQCPEALTMLLLPMSARLATFISHHLGSDWQALTHMLVLSLASTVTQYMISYTIKRPSSSQIQIGMLLHSFRFPTCCIKLQRFAEAFWSCGLHSHCLHATSAFGAGIMHAVPA